MPTKQLRLAEMVASTLREDIVSGTLADGDALPTLDTLVKEFEVSPPSIREALRILENEGLITVRRGNVGGAVVHRPSAGAAAYTIGLVLQSQRARAADLETALLELQPVCAALCARRKDRATAVVPQLTEALDRAQESMDDIDEFTRWMFAFHDRIVRRSGNQTMILVVGALGALWTAQRLPWPHRVALLPQPYQREDLERAVAVFRPVVDAISAGDAPAASDRLHQILDDPETFAREARRRNPVIRATDIRPVELGPS